MICPYCKEEIMDGAVKCKHCQSMLTEISSKQEMSAKPTAAADPQQSRHTDNNTSKEMLLARIEDSGTWGYIKQILRLYVEKPFQLKHGIPVFADSGDQMKAFSFLTLLAGGWFYIYFSTSKKLLSVLGVYVVFGLIIKLLPSGNTSFFALLFFALIFHIYLGLVGYYDFYRSKILQEKFWW